MQKDFVKKKDNSKATLHTRTQKVAIDRARQISTNQKSELVIMGKDHKIRSKDSHGYDPHPPKG